MAKVELCRMTWREAEAAFRRNPVVLIPMASIEEHGPRTPVGDYRYVAEVARRIAERTDAVVAPTIPWGYSDLFRPFPGTLSLRPETLRRLLEDLCDGFLRFGLDHLLFVCGHGPNLPIIEQVARRLRATHRLRTATLEPWAWLTPAFKRAAYGDEAAAVGHGSDPFVSLAMALFPEEVQPGAGEAAPPPTFGGLRLQGLSRAEFEGAPIHIYLDFDEVTPTGVLGDPNLASAEIGNQLLDHVVAIGSQFVHRFAEMPTRIEGLPGPRTMPPG